MSQANQPKRQDIPQERDMPQIEIHKSASGGAIGSTFEPSPADAAMAALDRMDEASLDSLLLAQGVDPDALASETRLMAASFRALLNTSGQPAPASEPTASDLPPDDATPIESIRFFEECVAAGSPQWNNGSAGGRDLAASDLFGKRDFRKMFTTRVKGASMTPDGIFDGDIVLVDPTVEARDGDIVVAYVESQGQVVKRLRVGGNGILLESSNPDCPSVRVKSWTELAIQGVVRGRAGMI